MNIILNIFLITTFFPYIKFFNIGTNTDTQFYAVIFGAIICSIYSIINNLKVKKVYIFLTLYMFFLIFIIFIIGIYKSDGTILNIIKGSFPYISIAIIPWATNILLNCMEFKHLEWVLKLFYLIWTIVGCIQIFNPLYLTGWRERAIITDDRGAISLANEPAYFIIVLILISMILIVLNYKRNKKFMVYNVIIAIFIAQNAVGTIYGVCLLLIMNANKINLKTILKILSLITIVSIGIYIYVSVNKSDRISVLTLEMINNPIGILFKDASLNIRFAHLYLSFKGAVENLLLPNGVLEWGQYYYDNVIRNREIFIEPLYRLTKTSNKIVSMHGGFVYEIGVFALPMYIFVFNKIKKINKGISIYIFILILGLNGLNVSNPIFCFFIGLIIYKSTGGDIKYEKEIICM